MAEVVQVQKRQGQLGTTASRRLRASGEIPAVLYGHKQSNEHLSITQKSVESILRHHSRIVELQGAVNETALVSSVQYDPMGIDVIHIDLVRVDMNERVNVMVPILFKGEPKGGKLGGIVIENAHEVEVRCLAVAIPDSLRLTVTGVGLDEHRNASDLELPENVELVSPGDLIIFHIEKPKGLAAAEEPEA